MRILVGFTLFLFQTTQTEERSLIDLILKASPIAKAVLALLLLFSVVSWAIIFSKWFSLRRAERATSDFLARFSSRAKLSDVYIDSENNRQSPVARLFLAGYREITNQMGDEHGRVRSVESVQRVLQSASIDEVSSLEKNLSWLATTANASPFIGLFGTVVGIVIAFQGLTTATTSSIQSVAPGIAEALIATAAGIAAAVPAAIFYNYFLNRIKSLTAVMDRFSLELLNLIERNYIKANV
ncbi:MAG TPA: MotA/TolQ/ExbB proton channel family protein [Blastocatellia bacterium]|nr:MotA/TolQ/ExbB proton channel family protein [Blastocatellia bacterium]